MTRLAIIFSLVLVTPAWAETVFYCQEKFSVGIKKDKDSREWRRAHFNKERFTIKWDEENLTLKRANRRFILKCEPAAYEEGIYNCADDKKITIYKFSPKYMRFVHFNAFGSWILDGFIEESSEFGICEKF